MNALIAPFVFVSPLFFSLNLLFAQLDGSAPAKAHFDKGENNAQS
jgi:hypothetical protein